MPVKLDRRVTAFCSRQALLKNFRALSKRAQGLSLLPMVKANAYGHGLEWVVRTLSQEPSFHDKIEGFGVATFSEAHTVRRVLGARAKARVVLFSGAMPWSSENQDYCAREKISPVISSLQDLKQFLREKGDLAVPTYELKFNTGMNRLGIRYDEWSEVEVLFQKEKRKRSVKNPYGVFSHLAVAEAPKHAVSRFQLKQFKNLRPEWKRLFPESKIHLGNSAALWNAKAFELSDLTEIVRPGLALYGVRPFHEAKAEDLKPVMELRAPVVQIISVKAGECVGYGAHFRAPRFGRSPLSIAILAAGYGDGIPRILGNSAPFAGRISMDLCAVELGAVDQSTVASRKSGGWVEIFGRKGDIWKQAQAANTIPYELLTSVAARVERKYGA